IVGDAAEALGPGFVAGDGVDRYTQHVGITLLEAAEVSLIRGHLHGSNRCPGQRVERDEDVLLAAKVGQLDFVAVVARQLKVGRHVAYFYSHWHSSSQRFNCACLWFMPTAC